jgi:hypothetical protein
LCGHQRKESSDEGQHKNCNCCAGGCCVCRHLSHSKLAQLSERARQRGTSVIDSEITNPFSNCDTSPPILSLDMSVLAYLSRAFPSAEPPAVVDALLSEGCVTECEDGRFMAILLKGNRQIKIPSEMGQGCPIKLADRILLEWGVKIGGSWANTHAGCSSKHAQVARRFADRLSPPAILEPLFTVSEGSLRQLISTLVLRLRMSVSSTAITRAFQTAVATPWKLSITQSRNLADLCVALAIPTVMCAANNASFVVDGKVSLKSSPKDMILLT